VRSAAGPATLGVVTTMTRGAISAAVDGDGWRLILGRLRTAVAVASLPEAASVATGLARRAGELADHVEVRLAAGRVELALGTPGSALPTSDDVLLAAQLTETVTALGFTCTPAVDGGPVVQTLELAIDALDIAAVRPFWAAVLGYVDELPGETEPNGLADPHGRGPTLWFQQLDVPRAQRNRIHFDIAVPAEERAARIEAALSAGGMLLSAAEAPAFWILADPEGNEVCVCTWQGRD
jgi:4a-hydroxytetrahydrobiopterin dehydratase